MTTIVQYYVLKGEAGMRRLAEDTGLRLSYLMQLVYDQRKRPSAEAALSIIKASGDLITLEGLCNPTPRPKRARRAVAAETEAAPA